MSETITKQEVAHDSLITARKAQKKFWDALADLENDLAELISETEETSVGVDRVNVDSTQNLDAVSIEDLLASSIDSGECTCAERSWYGEEHDTECELTGTRHAVDS
jgi:hypothetical protein